MYDWAIAGNKWLTKRALGTKTSADLKARSGTSAAPDSMMMGASGLSRRISIANSCPFISGMDKHSAQTGQLLARWGMLHAVRSVLSGLALLLFLYLAIFRKPL